MVVGCFFLLLFPVLFFIPYVRINAQDGFGVSPLCASIPFFFFSSPMSFLFSLALVHVGPAEAGVGFPIINNLLIISLKLNFKL